MPSDSYPRGLMIQTCSADNVPVLAVAGTVDMCSAPELADHITKELSSSPSTLVIDLSEVELLASAGLEVLVRAHQAGGEVTSVVIVADGVAGRPIKLTGVDRIVTVRPTREEALAAVHSG